MNATIFEKVVKIPLQEIDLTGDLAIPEDATGIILFSHGSGSSRLSPRNNFVASVLQERGFATLLFDLLTAKEDEDYEKRFDIELLTRRLVEVTDWAATYPATRALSVGYFGASTGAASAMFAAAKLDGRVKAVVSRGGRTDLALSAVPQLQAPTLLIVGSLDRDLVSMNKMVFEQLLCEKEFTLVKGATHLFQEPGKLEEVAELAARWFESHL